MRWLLVSSQHHSKHGGIGTYVGQFLSAAHDAGWHVELVTRPGSNYPPAGAVHTLITPDMHDDFNQRMPGLRRMERIRPYRYALWSRAVAETLANIRGEFDAVEFVDCQAEGFASLGSRMVRARFGSTPMIIHAHTPMFLEETLIGADVTRFGRELYHDWERRALQSADAVMATSRALLQRLPALRCSTVIPYPIAETHNAEPRRNATEIILLIGTAHPRKGIDTWARSLNTIFEKHPNSRAVLIGSDTPTAPNGTSMVTHVRTLIDSRFINRFHWTGALAHAEVLQWIREAALVVVPSVFESFSFAAAEALLCGCPVIVSDQVGLTEHVAGLPRFTMGDVEALAVAQRKSLSNREAAMQTMHECRARMLESCSPKRHLHLRERFIQRVKAGERSSTMAGDLVDAFVESSEFLAAVEEREHGEALASSARS